MPSKEQANAYAKGFIFQLQCQRCGAAVDALNAAGVRTKIYDDPNLQTDDKGIARGMGPDIAWFKDPAGNVISVIQESGVLS